MCDIINWARLLAFVTGLVNQELLLQNEYLAAENRILRCHLPVRLRLCNAERCTLAEIGKRLGRKGLKPVACTAQPDTMFLNGCAHCAACGAIALSENGLLILRR
jgi:putative transposase